MVVRGATAVDWPAIAALLTRHRLPTDGADQHLAHFLVAVDGTTLAGVAGLEIHGDAALLRSVAVAQPHTGLGSRLVVAALDHARAARVQDVVLLTTTAAGYFSRFGFARIARTDVPVALLSSAEFRGACPASAEVMQLRLVASS